MKAEIKIKVVLEAIKEQSSLAELASKANVAGSQISTWKSEFLNQANAIITHTKQLGEMRPNIIFGMVVFVLHFSCSNLAKNEESNKIWYLKYEMLICQNKGEYGPAEKKLDTILSIEPKTSDAGVFVSAMKILYHNGNLEKLHGILETVPFDIKFEICQNYYYHESIFQDFCKGMKSSIDLNNPKLKELIIMYYNDQYDRGNDNEELLFKYGLNRDSILYSSGNVDEINLIKLKLMLKDSFPKKKVVGQDGLRAIFFITLHSRQIEFQESVLDYMEKNLTKGEFEKSEYAYLYDRICYNKNIPQKYGTQFDYVNKKNGITKLHPLIDSLRVDSLRKSMGLSPLSVYKELMLL